MALRDTNSDFFRNDGEIFPQPDYRAVQEAFPGLTEAVAESTAKGTFEKHWLQTLAHVLTDEVQELHSAEKLLAEMLPRMTLAVSDDFLRRVCESHVKQTREQLQRLETVQQILGLSSDDRHCLTLDGLILGMQETIAENDPGRSRDRGLISAAYQIKHYEVAGYCSARDFAQLLGIESVTSLLQKTLDEEYALETRFTNLAEILVSHAENLEYR